MIIGGEQKRKYSEPQYAIEDHFRFDINALRAASVVAVVGYHLEIAGFLGGFAGVDVFLVITGYLMTDKVVTDLLRDRFSFYNFTLSRLRRIYPALAMMVIASIIAGWFLTLPREYIKHLLQALSALAFVSNFAFDADHGYFAMAAQTKPLLHTWSLSVEWQFYIWMPLALALVWQFAGSRSRIGLVMITCQVAAVLSFAWCLWESHHDELGSAFFSLRARAWEPLVGSLIAIAEIRRSEAGQEAPWFETRVVALVGWLIIVACVALPLPKSQWPGVITILPMLGAACVISSRQWIGRDSLLALPAVQRIGDWSYSIYLWHWPTWVFALGWLSSRGYDVNDAEKACIVLAMLGLSVASYLYVEEPIRARRDRWASHRLLTVAGIIFGVLAIVAGAGHFTDGFPSRLPGYLQRAELARTTDTPRSKCFRNANGVQRSPELYCGFGSEQTAGRPSIILWGDSFANQYLDPVVAAALANNVHGLIATQSGCRPLLEDPDHTEAPACRQFNRTTLDFLRYHQEPSIVVMDGNWSDAREIPPLVDDLLSFGKTVVLILPTLDLGFDLSQRWIERQIEAQQAIDEWKVPVDPILTRQALRTAMVRLLDRERSNPRLVMVDPQPVVCSGEECYLVRNGQANFRDSVHISELAAAQYNSLFDRALRAALNEPAGTAAIPD